MHYASRNAAEVLLFHRSIVSVLARFVPDEHSDLRIRAKAFLFKSKS